MPNARRALASAEFWPGTAREVGLFLADIRPSDVLELQLLCKATGRDFDLDDHRRSLEAEAAAGRLWTLWVKGELACVGGVAGDGIVWMQGTRAAMRHWRLMNRAIRRFTRLLDDWHGPLWNVAPKSMVARRKWLKHVGFDLVEGEAQLAHMGLVAFRSRPRAGPEG